jgi:Domain of unknown function (DUF4301)
MTSSVASPTLSDFSSSDLVRLAAAGIEPEAAARQLALLRTGMRHPQLLRPCTLGDGIARLDDEDYASLGDAYREACAAGRWVFFIPASGAATRMAASLTDPAAVEKLRAHPAFARSTLLELLKDPTRWALLPKALMPFHRVGETVRTPIEEHMREAAALAPGARARLHFTISPEHETLFLEDVARVQALLQPAGIETEVTHSFQDPATQTLALDEHGNPFRDAEGNLLLRPGGHGSLLRNLESVARAHGAEFVWIRNIDNIPVEPIRAEGRALRRALGGLLMRNAAASPARPTRIAGMVKNVGEPGGGPFWIQGAQGPEVRIVESAEVNAHDASQRELFRSGTHFNPVDLACALRAGDGTPFTLDQFSEPSACFVAEKTFAGRTLKALEWPGLWNGSMAHWNTQCVEIPLSQFAPVKTVADLLRDEHLGA